MQTLATTSLRGRKIPSHKLKLRLHLSNNRIVNNGQNIISPSNIKAIADIAIFKKTATSAAILPEVEVVAAGVEEVVVHLEVVEEEAVVANNRTTPRMSLKALHLNLNLNHNPPSRPHSSPSSPSSPKHSSLNHRSQTNSRSLQSRKVYQAGGRVIWL